MARDPNQLTEKLFKEMSPEAQREIISQMGREPDAPQWLRRISAPPPPKLTQPDPAYDTPIFGRRKGNLAVVVNESEKARDDVSVFLGTVVLLIGWHLTMIGTVIRFLSTWIVRAGDWLQERGRSMRTYGQKLR